jgi:hypothetical protein
MAAKRPDAVTISPAVPSDTPKLLLISGSMPIGKNSVKTSG